MVILVVTLAFSSILCMKVRNLLATALNLTGCFKLPYKVIAVNRAQSLNNNKHAAVTIRYKTALFYGKKKCFSFLFLCL